MRIKSNTPKITALRIKVEKKFGCPVCAPRHFSSLSNDIEESLHEYLSETTLQRIWQYKSGYNTVAIHSLNVLCRYAGYSDWVSFSANVKSTSPVESLMHEGESIDVANLPIGAKIKIGWLPDRVCIIKYLGDYRFQAIETHNSKISAGDKFTCSGIQKGRAMSMENLVRGDSDLSYVVGSRNGLTTLEIIED